MLLYYYCMIVEMYNPGRIIAIIRYLWYSNSMFESSVHMSVLDESTMQLIHSRLLESALKYYNFQR
jgi:hypothetical protein